MKAVKRSPIFIKIPLKNKKCAEIKHNHTRVTKSKSILNSIKKSLVINLKKASIIFVPKYSLIFNLEDWGCIKSYGSLICQNYIYVIAIVL